MMKQQDQQPRNEGASNGVCPDFDERSWAAQAAPTCLVAVWPAGSVAPNPERLRIERELVLDRELLAVTDRSISSSPHAPRITPRAARRVNLHVPANCSTGALVVRDTDFESLQRGLGPSGGYALSPAALSRSSKLALGRYMTLALVHSLPGSDHEHCDQLVPLPSALRVPPGSEVVIDLPAIVVVGAGAIALHTNVSLSPTSAGRELAAPCGFQLPTNGFTFAAARELDALPQPEFNTLRIAGHEGLLVAAELPAVAAQALARLQRHFAFLPALLDDREPRLLLAYERHDGAVGWRLSTRDVASWVVELGRVLTQADGGNPARCVSVSNPSHASGAHEQGAPQWLAQPTGFGRVVTLEPGFAQQLQSIHSVADSNVRILVLGESGTGKEHLAREIHLHSRRAEKPFVAINCASMTESLVESELFGHTRGAFTGTTGARAGAFVEADGGTLLLDEIADAPLRVQLALLRVLEQQRVKPVGADRERAVDVRVIAATSRDPRELIAAGSFRQDLYYRLAGLTVTLPALRQRRKDIARIAQTLLQGLGHSGDLSPEALVYLAAQAWPGNVRELLQSLQLAVHLSAPDEAISVQRLLTSHSIAPAPEPVCSGSQFPPDVRIAADHLWRTGDLPPLEANSQYTRRAQHRAALVYLCARYGGSKLPHALSLQWQQLFGPRWSSTENERGLRDVLRVLGLRLRDATARAWLLGVVATHSAWV